MGAAGRILGIAHGNTGPPGLLAVRGKFGTDEIFRALCALLLDQRADFLLFYTSASAALVAIVAWDTLTALLTGTGLVILVVADHVNWAVGVGHADHCHNAGVDLFPTDMIRRAVAVLLVTHGHTDLQLRMAVQAGWALLAFLLLATGRLRHADTGPADRALVALLVGHTGAQIFGALAKFADMPRRTLLDAAKVAVLTGTFLADLVWPALVAAHSDAGAGFYVARLIWGTVTLALAQNVREADVLVVACRLQGLTLEAPATVG